jgi:hypothetical protein
MDPNCTPPPADPCAQYAAIPADHTACTEAIPKCPGFVGSPLQTCLDHYVAISHGPPPPPPPPTNRAVGWQATMTDTTLFDPQANAENQNGAYDVKVDAGGTVQINEGGGKFLDQKDAFASQASMLGACATTSVNGRTDDACAADPNNPECTGLNAALGNATTCSQPGPVDPNTGQPTCLAYGAFGYNVNEWLVFGQQYFNGMAGCFAVGDTADSTGLNPTGDRTRDRGGRLQALTDFAAFPPGTGAGPLEVSGSSTITGQPGKNGVTEAQTVRWKAVADKVDDGAAYLGLERGALIERAATGQTFLSAFTDSPFAEKLAKTARDLAEAALADPTETLDAVKQRRLAEAGDAPAIPSSPSGSSVSQTSTASAEGPSRQPASAGPAPAAASSRAAANPPGAPARTLLEGGAAATAPPNPQRTGTTLGANAGNSDLADARALLGTSPPGKAAPAAPAAGSQTSPELGSSEASLFERVSLSYRRYTPELRAYEESKTARDVRLTEKPAFFQDL